MTVRALRWLFTRTMPAERSDVIKLKVAALHCELSKLRYCCSSATTPSIVLTIVLKGARKNSRFGLTRY